MEDSQPSGEGALARHLQLQHYVYFNCVTVLLSCCLFLAVMAAVVVPVFVVVCVFVIVVIVVTVDIAAAVVVFIIVSPRKLTVKYCKNQVNNS